MKVQENMELIETFVTEFRNHPALFAWMVMDEPALNHKDERRTGGSLPACANARPGSSRLHG